MGQGRLMEAERRFLTCDPGKPARLGGASRRAGLGCGVGRKGKKGEGQQQPQADHEVLTRRACRQRPASAAEVNLRRARIAPERHSRRTRAKRPIRSRGPVTGLAVDKALTCRRKKRGITIVSETHGKATV